jgi:hypothetical protein
VLEKIAAAGTWVHVTWIASLIGLVLMLVFGTEAVRRLAGEVIVVRTLGLLAVVLLVMPLAWFLKLLVWWLRTWRSDRLRPALVFLTEHVPLFAMLAATIGLSVYLEKHFRWPHMLALAGASVLMFAIGIPWSRWVHPAIERTLLRASNSALKVGVAVLAMVVTVLATGGVGPSSLPRHERRCEGSSESLAAELHVAGLARLELPLTFRKLEKIVASAKTSAWVPFSAVC